METRRNNTGTMMEHEIKRPETDINGQLDRLWEFTNKLGQQQSSLAATVTTLTKSHESLVDSVERGFREMRMLLEERTRQRPTNWVGIASLIVGVATAMAALGLFAIQPIADTARENRNEVRLIQAWQLGHVERFSDVKAHAEDNSKSVDIMTMQLSAIRERVAKTEALIKQTP